MIGKWPCEETEPVAFMVEDLDALSRFGEHLCLLSADDQFDHNYVLQARNCCE